MMTKNVIRDCTDNSISIQAKKGINKDVNNKCNQFCDASSLYPYEYNGKCYANCEKGFLHDSNNNKVNKCKCELDECLLCPQEALSKGLCSECNVGYYQKEIESLNTDEYIKCYKNPEGYYLDNKMYKQCYYTCKTCNISGNITNHNCIECNDTYSFEIKQNNFINCYANCTYYFYFDEENNYHCTQDLSCPNDYPKLNNQKECIRANFQNIMQEIIVFENKETEKMSKEDEIEHYDDILEIIVKGFSENFDNSKLDNGEDEYIGTEKITVTLTTVENQRNNIMY